MVQCVVRQLLLQPPTDSQALRIDVLVLLDVAQEPA